MMDFGAIIIADGIVRRVRAIGDIGIGDTDIGGINTFCEVLMKNNKPINKNMAKRWRRAAYVAAFVALWLPEDGLANSYIEMITTAPEGYVSETNNAYAAGGYGAPAVILQTVDGKYIPIDTAGYATAPTVSPVVTPEYPKYLAWRRAQEDGFAYDEFHEGVQNLIYFAGGAALARVAYDIWGPYHHDHWLGD